MKPAVFKAAWVLMLTATFAGAPKHASAKDLLDVALEIQGTLDNQLRECGLLDADAYGANVPRPQVPAHKSWALPVGAAFKVIAHVYRETGSGGQRWVTKLPNGQSLGWVGLENDDRVEVGNRFTGKFASMNTFFTPNGQHFNYFCRSQKVTPQQWEQCVQAFLVEVVENDLCQ